MFNFPDIIWFLMFYSFRYPSDAIFFQSSVTTMIYGAAIESEANIVLVMHTQTGIKWYVTQSGRKLQDNLVMYRKIFSNLL